MLAGHSLGGLFALSYAHRYPAQVAGVVLLDSMHPRQDSQFVRDVNEIPAALDRAAALTSLGDRPMAVVTAGTGSAAGWAAEQNALAHVQVQSTTPKAGECRQAGRRRRG